MKFCCHFSVNFIAHFYNLYKLDMNLLYGKNKYFIGVIYREQFKYISKFEHFGFITSNNCGMSNKEYHQRIRFNTDSLDSIFIDFDKYKKSYTAVVFQIEKCEKKSVLAVNMRKFNEKSKDDIELAMKYYDAHETINDEFGLSIIQTHLFGKLGIPFPIVCKHVENLIRNDHQRSLKNTIAHFSKLAEIYSNVRINKNKLIYRYMDLRLEEYRKALKSLFSILTDEEMLSIIKKYDFTLNLVDRKNFIPFFRERVDSLLTINSDNLDLKELAEFIDSLHNNIKKDVKMYTEEKADKILHAILENSSNKSDITEGDFNERIKQYLNFTSNKHENDIQQCIKSIRYNKFLNAIDSFLQSDNFSPVQLCEAFNAMDESESQKHQGEYEDCVHKKIEELISNKKIYNVICLLEDQFSKFAAQYREQLLKVTKEFLCDELLSCVNDFEEIQRKVLNWKYTYVMNFFNNKEKYEIISSLQQTIIKTKSLEVLYKFYCSNYVKIKIEYATALNRAKDIIYGWNYTDIMSYIEKKEIQKFIFDVEEKNFIIDRAFSLIENKSISEAFDDEGDYFYYTSGDIEKDNLKYLQFLKKEMDSPYINNDNIEYCNPAIKKRWDNYIVNNIFNTISYEKNIDFVYFSKEYKQHEFEHMQYKDILQDSDCDIFKFIVNKIKETDFSDDNLTKYAYILELIYIKKFQNVDIQTARQLGYYLTPKLLALKQSQPQNKRLAALLWAVFYLTPASIAGLRDIFHCLPPYVQIRCVRKLFQLIATGKMRQTAEGLYDMLGGKAVGMCIPLEIVFSYLMRREKDPKATIDNRLMLNVFADRDDHSEWTNISTMLTACPGRWSISVESMGKYRNGLYRKFNDKTVELFVPKKMIDEKNELTKYNNKYFDNIVKLVEISFVTDEYKKTVTQEGITYSFAPSYEIPLMGLARYYNIRFDEDNTLFTLNEKSEEPNRHIVCECRLANVLSNETRPSLIFSDDSVHNPEVNVPFYWCERKPCYGLPLRFRTDDEWEQYTVLDFMRILGIPTDYKSVRTGKTTRFGYYIMLSAYINSFKKFYDHLKCRSCGKLMKPADLSNFGSSAVTEFACADESCAEHGRVVYLNNCFNRPRCTATIDSRDSAKCPNGLYICPECGGCCSTSNFRRRISDLQKTGGTVSSWLVTFVRKELGHWERQERFCYKCGKEITFEHGVYYCKECGQHINKLM